MLVRPAHKLLAAFTFAAFTFVMTLRIAAPAFAQTVPAPAGWTESNTASGAVYRPDNLPPGKTFTLTIPPAQPRAGQPLPAWFTAQVQADLQQRGIQAHAGKPQANPDGTLIMLVPYKDSSGQSWTAMYAAAARASEARFCSMISNLPSQEMTPYVRFGGAIFSQNVKQATGGQSPTHSQSPAKPASPGKPPSPDNTKPSGGDTAHTGKPGAGVPEANIAGVLHEGRGTSTATGFQYVESVDLLLSDGWAYSGLSLPPEDFDAEASKHAEPQKWHHWRRQGSAIYLEVNGNWSKLDADPARPLESGSALSKKLVHRNATSFGGMGGTVGTARIQLYPDGHFERSSNTLAGSGTVQASGGFSGGAASRTDSHGTTSSASGTHTGNGGSVTARSNRSSSAGAGAATGKYRITGYTLELDSANGQVQRLLAFYPFPGKPQVYLGNATFNEE